MDPLSFWLLFTVGFYILTTAAVSHATRRQRALAEAHLQLLAAMARRHGVSPDEIEAIVAPVRRVPQLTPAAPGPTR